MITPESFSLPHMQCLASNLPIPATVGQSFIATAQMFPLGMSGDVRERTAIPRRNTRKKHACVFDLTKPRSFGDAIWELKGRNYEPLWKNERQVIEFICLHHVFLHNEFTFFPFVVPEDFTDENEKDEEEPGITHSPFVARVYGTYPELGLRVYRFEHPYIWSPGARFVLPQVGG